MKRVLRFLIATVALSLMLCLTGCSTAVERGEYVFGGEPTDWTGEYGQITASDCYVPADNDFTPERGAHIYEAENAEAWFSTRFEEYDGYAARITVDNNRSGGKIVDYFGSGEYLTFNIRSTKACTVLVVLCMATDTAANFTAAPAPCVVTVKNNEAQDKDYNLSGGVAADASGCVIYSSGGWASFVEVSLGEVPIVAGNNAIRVHAHRSINLDYIALVPKPAELESSREAIGYTGRAVKVRCAYTNGTLASCTCLPNADLGYDVVGNTTGSTQVSFYITADKPYGFVRLRLSAAFGRTALDTAANDDDNDEWLYNRIAVTVNDRAVSVDPGFYPAEDAAGNITANYTRRTVRVGGADWDQHFDPIVLCNIDLVAGVNKIVIQSQGYDKFCLNYLALDKV